MTKRKTSFLCFIAAVLVVGVYFFRIIQPFLLPILVAGMMALLTHPAYQRAVLLLRGHRRMAAALVSLGVVILILLPVGVVLTFATRELVQHGQEVVRETHVSSGMDDDSPGLLQQAEQWLAPYLGDSVLSHLREEAVSVGRSALTDISHKTSDFIADLASFVIGMAVMILTLYYFLAEGPTIAQEIEKVLPFESEDEVAVLKQFDTICRGVVIGTLAGAVAQATLLGLALGALQISGTWLLTCLTLIAAMVPFVGAGAVYVPVSAILLWGGRYGAGVFLLLYGAVIVSSIDNLIRAHMIHGTSRLHPLVALISALGAIKLTGLWGIFVGPVVAGIFYAMLKILQQKLSRIDEFGEPERLVAHESDVLATRPH